MAGWSSYYLGFMKTQAKRKLSEIDLLRIGLPEERYRVDMILFDQGQHLSAELLKLALAGIAAVGVFLSFLLKTPAAVGLTDDWFRLLFMLAVIGFAISIAVALLQRFYAGGAMFHHIKAMKLASQNDAGLHKDIEENLAVRLSQFMRASTLLKASAFFLSLGATLLGGALIRMLFVL